MRSSLSKYEIPNSGVYLVRLCARLLHWLFDFHVGDIDRAYYRPKSEEEQWKSRRDPIKLLADWLKKNKMADAKALQAVENDISTEIKAAVNFALNAPYPEPEEVTQHVYA